MRSFVVKSGAFHSSVNYFLFGCMMIINKFDELRDDQRKVEKWTAMAIRVCSNCHSVHPSPLRIAEKWAFPVYNTFSDLT
jgi:hypothetical protein